MIYAVLYATYFDVYDYLPHSCCFFFGAPDLVVHRFRRSRLFPTHLAKSAKFTGGAVLPQWLDGL